MILTVLIIIIVFAFALLGFAQVQDELPEELAFLKGAGAGLVDQDAAGLQRGQYEGWQLAQDGHVIEVSRKFSGELQAAGAAYEAPVIGLLCDNGRLDVRIDTRLATSGETTSLVYVNSVPSAWAKGYGTNIFPADSLALVSQLMKAKNTAEVALEYRDLGKRTLQLDVSRLPKVLEMFPASCRPQ